MATGPQDFVTGPEFGRFRADFQAFQDRIEQRIEHGFTGINARLDLLNGRTRSAEQTIAVVERRLMAIESEDGAIEATIEQIQQHGCGKLGTHEMVLRELGWTPQKKAAVAGGLVTTGALMWPAIQKIAEAVHAVIDRMPR